MNARTAVSDVPNALAASFTEYANLIGSTAKERC
jgi:hypothetical protein